MIRRGSGKLLVRLPGDDYTLGALSPIWDHSHLLAPGAMIGHASPTLVYRAGVIDRTTRTSKTRPRCLHHC